MAHLKDKIAEITDTRLRQEIAAEVAELKKTTRFGLVFEGHQPRHRLPVSPSASNTSERLKTSQISQSHD